MRVTVVTESAGVWGAERSLLQIVDSLSILDRGSPSFDFVIGRNSPLVSELKSRGYKWNEFNFTPMKLPDRRYSSGVAKVARWLNRGLWLVGAGWRGVRLSALVKSSDVILCFSAHQVLEAFIASRIVGSRLVLDLHETWGGRMLIMLVRILACIGVIVVSPSRSLLDRCKVSDGVVVPRGVDPSVLGGQVRATPAMAGGLRRIGIVGQVVPHKRVLEVARAFIDADTTTCQLVIVGFSSVEEPSAYEREVIRVSAPHSRITLQERTDDPNSVISQLDVLINSSVHEAFGRTIIEALASGALPVSVGGAAGPQEIIRDVGTGVVLDDFGELSDFFTAINKGGVDAAFTQRERLRRNEVAKRYSINRLAPLYLSVLGTGAHE